MLRGLGKEVGRLPAPLAHTGAAGDDGNEPRSQFFKCRTCAGRPWYLSREGVPNGPKGAPVRTGTNPHRRIRFRGISRRGNAVVAHR